MDKLIPTFKTSLFDSHLKDIATETLEIGIDSLLDEGIFKDIPIVRTIIGVTKTAQNIHDRNLLQQTIAFISTLNNGEIDAEKVKKHQQKLDSNSDFAEKELGRIIILLNSHIDLIKSKILANFYRAYVSGNLTWDQFCELSDVNSRAYVSDFNLFNDIAHHKTTDTSQCKHYQAERLISLGLLDYADKYHRLGSNRADPMPKIIGLSELGLLFFKYSK